MSFKKSYHLVALSDKRTWKFDRPVIFLGEWCNVDCQVSLKKGWHAIQAKPYGLTKENKDRDHNIALAIEEELLAVLTEVLNKYHETSHSSRFWRIILGHWLRRYVYVMINRVKTLKQCLQLYTITGTTLYSSENYSLATLDSYSAIWAFNDDRWNSALLVSILDMLENIYFPREYIHDEDHCSFFKLKPPANKILKYKFSERLYTSFRFFSKHFFRDTDAFIINSYLPRGVELVLQLTLGQFPQVRRLPKFYTSKIPDVSLRKMLASQCTVNSSDDLHRILSAMVFHLLPVCYLEGFSDLKTITANQFLPKTPKFIFTSNNFDTDEVFKFWTATKAESGFTYIVGQHGSQYGTYRYSKPSIEEATADKFLTWGWRDGLSQHTPTFILKLAGKRTAYYDKQGGLLLIELCLPHRLFTWDSTAEFSNYFLNQKRFVAKLNSEVRQKLILRLHSGYQKNDWQEVDKWKAFDASLTLDHGSTPIQKLISKARLVVHSYDSTGILETLSQNIPTMAFWQNGFDHLRDSAIPYYKMLNEVGIIHLSYESAGVKINEVWNDIDSWWFSEEVQAARRLFCDNYARISKTPIFELKSILLDR